MGIRGVWSLFRQQFPRLFPLDVPSKRIGIDMFSLVYTHRAHLKELLELLKQWSDHGHHLTCVWDGVAPTEKKEIVNQRRSARESAMDQKQELAEYLEKFGSQLSETDVKHLKTAITSLSWQGWHMTGTLRKEIIEALGPAVQHIQAEGEADDLLLEMALDQGKFDVLMSLDSDLFAMGAPEIWRILHIRGEWIIEQVRVEDVCGAWGLRLGQLQDACFLAGWDRFPGASPYMTFEQAVNRIKHYRLLTTVLEKWPPKTPVEEDRLNKLKILKAESRKRWVALQEKREDHGSNEEESCSPKVHPDAPTNPPSDAVEVPNACPM